MLLAATIFGSTGIAGAVNIEDTSIAVTAEYSESEVTPRADVIVTKYRYLNGVYQYRRWNETKGYWVDPEWINV